ncbi:MAG: type III-A CRISPR-associated RAMP protein Csm5 [Candidatus Methanomethylicaceae archaeon]
MIRLTMETLTPVHIWSGSTYGPSDYYVEGGMLTRIDFYRLVGESEFSRYRDRIMEALRRRDSIRKVAPALAERHILYNVKNTGVVEGKLIREYIKTAGRPYVPGSSLKGAILTALVWDHVKSGKFAISDWEFRAREKETEKRSKELIRRVLQEFGRSGQRDMDPLFNRWIRIADSEPARIEDLLAAKVTVYPNGPPIYEEVLRAGASLHFEFESISGADLEGILKKTDEFYRTVLSRENEWRKDKGLRELRLPENGTLVRIGSGSSQLATSVRIIKPNGPRTRKLVEQEKISMGWAVLR